MSSIRFSTKLWAGVAVAGILSGCAGNPLAEGPDRLSDRDIHERSAEASMRSEEALNLFQEKPVTILETDSRHSFELLIDSGEQVPRVPVGQINASPMLFPELLNQITEQVGMSWVITGRNKENLMSKDIYFVQRSETMLESVLEELSKSTNSFYRVEADRIIFSQDELFVTNVPRMAGSLDILTEGIENVGATEIFSDQLTGTISFRADRETLAAVQALMKSFEQGRDMIVYDFWIIERSLSDGSALGVDVAAKFATSHGDWETASEGGSSLAAALSNPGVESAMFSGNLGNISVEAAASMVRALGESETLARPTISMLSGATSTFESGERSEYIRSVRETTTDGVSTTGTDVEQLQTGVSVQVSGAHNGGVVSTDFELEVSELIAFDEFDTGDVQLRLPRTSERTLSAHLEARPGDVLALGGIIRDRQDRTEKGLTPAAIPIARSADADKTETIILVRPRLVQIRPTEGSRPGQLLKVESGVSRAPNALGEVISDEARTKLILEELKLK